MESEQIRLFVSYSQENKRFSEELVSYLQTHCLVWHDQRLAQAESWWTSVCEMIETCDCFVLILTPAYTNSVFCLTELEYAHKLGKLIVPVIPDRSVKLPPKITYFQSVPIHGFDLDEAYPKLIAAAGQLSQQPNSSRENRPPEPIPVSKEQVSVVFSDAKEAETVGNLALAAHFYKQVGQVDYGLLGTQATDKLNSLQQQSSCMTDYEKIVQFATDPMTLNAALDLWKIYRENHCYVLYDPNDFAHDPRFRQFKSPLTPNIAVSKEFRPQSDVEHKSVRSGAYGPDWIAIVMVAIAVGMVILTIIASMQVLIPFFRSLHQ